MEEDILHTQSSGLQQTIDTLRMQITANDATIAQQRHEVSLYLTAFK